MKVLFFIFAFFCGSMAMAQSQAVLISASKTVAASATPEALVAASTLSKDILVQAKSSNTQSVFVGPCSGTQDVELPAGTAIGISEIFKAGDELPMDLNKICLKVSVNGEGANLFYTKIVSQ